MTSRRRSRQHDEPTITTPVEQLIPQVKPEELSPVGVVRRYEEPRGWRRELGDHTVTIVATILLVSFTVLMISWINPLGLMGKFIYPEAGGQVVFERSQVFPVEDLTVPATGLVVFEPTYEIAGKLQPTQALWLNGQQIKVAEDGSFSQLVPLLPEENSFHFALEEAGRRVVSVREIFYQPGHEAGQSVGDLQQQVTEILEEKHAAEVEDKLEVVVTVFPQSTWLEVTVDRQPRERVTLSPGGTLRFLADESVVVSTGNGSSTFVTLNDRQIGTLGEDNDEAKRSFTWDDVR